MQIRVFGVVYVCGVCGGVCVCVRGVRVGCVGVCAWGCGWGCVVVCVCVVVAVVFL